MFRGKVHVSIPVFPECDPSIIYGVFDTLWAAGRVWDNMKGGSPDGGLFEPRIVCAEPGPLKLITGSNSPPSGLPPFMLSQTRPAAHSVSNTP